MLHKMLKKIYTFMILILPITYQYSSIVPGVSFGELILLGTIFLCICFLTLTREKYNIVNVIKNPFWLLLLHVIIASMVAAIIQDSFSATIVFTRIVRFAFYCFCAFIMSYYFFDLSIGIKLYKRLAVLATLFLILQVILYNFNGYMLPGTIPGIPMVNDFTFDSVKQSLSRFYRPMSFFTEPGFYARYVLPYLAYCLFNQSFESKYNSSIKIALILTLGLLLSTSGQGILLGGLLWGLYFINKSYNLHAHTIRMKYLAIGLVLPITSIFVLRLDMIQKSLDRLWGGPMASSSLRIFRGFAVYTQFPILEKIVGVGYGNAGTYILDNSIYTPYDFPGMPEYMNSVAYILTGTGVLGLIILLWAYIWMFKRTKGFNRILALLFIILSFQGGILISPIMIFYLSLVFSAKQLKT